MAKKEITPEKTTETESPVFLYFFLGIMLLSIVFFAGYMMFAS